MRRSKQYVNTMARIQQTLEEIDGHDTNMHATSPTGQVISVGQVWESTDHRDLKYNQRKITIIRVDAKKGYVYGVSESNNGTTRDVRIRVSRMRPNSTGYRLISTPNLFKGGKRCLGEGPR